MNDTTKAGQAMAIVCGVAAAVSVGAALMTCRQATSPTDGAAVVLPDGVTVYTNTVTREVTHEVVREVEKPDPFVKLYQDSVTPATRGDAAAMTVLADCKLLGVGCSQNLGEALSLYEKAGRKNVVRADIAANLMKLYSVGVAGMEESGLDGLFRAAKSGYARARYELALCHQGGNGGVKTDYGQAYASLVGFTSNDYAELSDWGYNVDVPPIVVTSVVGGKVNVKNLSSTRVTKCSIFVHDGPWTGFAGVWCLAPGRCETMHFNGWNKLQNGNRGLIFCEGYARPLSFTINASQMSLSAGKPAALRALPTDPKEILARRARAALLTFERKGSGGEVQVQEPSSNSNGPTRQDFEDAAKAIILLNALSN